jgi:DNA-binding transcriptional LysR family regulator
MAEGLIADVVAEFLDAHPGVHLTLESHAPDQSKELVATRLVDCGIGKMPIDHPGIVHEPFVRVDTVCAMPTDHPLRKLRQVTPDDLRGEPLVLLGQGRTSRALIEAAFRQYGIAPQVRVETHTVGAACACAARGMGIAIVNGLMARQYAHRGVVLRRFEPRIVHELVFMTPATMPRPRLTQAFFNACREHVRRRKKDYWVVDEP